MRKPEESWLGRLAELERGERFSRPEGVPSVIRVGLVKVSVTPAGVVALRTGFAPSERDLALLRSLTGRGVGSGKAWSFDSEGLVQQANGLVLGRFRKCGLCTRRGGRRGSKKGSYRATRRGMALVNELAARFGPGWWREGGGRSCDRLPATQGGGYPDA